MMLLKDLTHFLDETLFLEKFSDDVSNNGLQIEGSPELSRVVFAVDATLDTIRFASENRAQMLFVHHGLSWGGNPRRWTGITARRFEMLFSHGISLYAAHLPLDAHPELGNNAALADGMALQNRRPFFSWNGMSIGIAGELKKTLSVCEIAGKLKRFCGGDPLCYGDEKRKVTRIAAVSGSGGPEALEEAAECGMELLVTGEFNHIMYPLARELDLPVLALGHYASETGGVKAVMRLLETTFSLETIYADFPTGL